MKAMKENEAYYLLPLPMSGHLASHSTYLLTASCHLNALTFSSCSGQSKRAVKFPNIDLTKSEIVDPIHSKKYMKQIMEKMTLNEGAAFRRVSVDAAADNELLEGMLTKALIKASDRRAITPELLFDPWITCDGTMFLRQYPDIKVNYSTVLDPELNAAIGKGSEMEVSANLKPVLAKLASKARTIVKGRRSSDALRNHGESP